MARIAHPWYFTEKKAYAHRQGAPRHPRQGREEPHQREARNKETPASPPGLEERCPRLRVADVIERYLKLHKDRYSERAFEERRRYLQEFAEAHGWRKVNDRECLPVHVEEWIAPRTPACSGCGSTGAGWTPRPSR